MPLPLYFNKADPKSQIRNPKSKDPQLATRIYPFINRGSIIWCWGHMDLGC